MTGVGQAVGLMLDKSKGLVLGSEKWNDSNAIFTGGSSRLGVNTYRIYASDTTYSAVYIPNILTTGKLYKLTFNIDSITQLGAGIAIEGNPTTVFTTTGQKSVYFFANTITAAIKRALSACDFQISNVSIKEIAGNHAYQTQSAMRPLLVASPQRLDFDTADDKLITALPAQLTGCTVVRSVPNVGTQILTNQTIPTPYNDNTDHCGLIVINRALTATETSQITRLFNKAAGV